VARSREDQDHNANSASTHLLSSFISPYERVKLDLYNKFDIEVEAGK